MSSTKIVTINPSLYKIFSENRQTFLKMKDIREQFVLLTELKLSTDELNKILYRQLIRLVKSNVLEKKNLGSAKNIGYKATDNFERSNFKFRQNSFEGKNNNTEVAPVQAIDTAVQKLTQELKQYEIDFQASIAESEEYKRLLPIVPELKKSLEKHYLQACENSNKLLGKMTAVKNMIEDKVAN